MSTLLFDIEADGLNATKVHCIVTIDTETEEVKTYGPDALHDGVASLLSADRLVGHNIIGYDIPTWIKQGLIDYVAPTDFFYPDFNAKYEEFAALTESIQALAKEKEEFEKVTKTMDAMLEEKYEELDNLKKSIDDLEAEKTASERELVEVLAEKEKKIRELEKPKKIVDDQDLSD